jgi:hypothetical protein
MKYTLDTDEMVEDFFDQTYCLGVVSPVKSYHFCWLMNYHLGMDFRVCTDDDVEMRRSERTYRFNLYHYKSQEDHIHYIYQNQFDGGYLMPEFKHLDYVWLIKMEDYQSELLIDIMDSLKTMDEIQLVIHISEEHIRNPSNLII